MYETPQLRLACASPQNLIVQHSHIEWRTADDVLAIELDPFRRLYNHLSRISVFHPRKSGTTRV